MKISRKILCLSVASLAATTSWGSFLNDEQTKPTQVAKKALTSSDDEEISVAPQLPQFARHPHEVLAFSRALQAQQDGKFEQAGQAWRVCLEKKYHFQKSEIDACCIAVANLENSEQAYWMLSTLFKHYKSMVSPYFNAEYARAAYRLGKYKEASDLVTKHLWYGHDHTPGVLLIGADSFYHLKDYKTAFMYFDELIRTTDLKGSFLEYYQKGAFTANELNDHKTAYKWMGRLFNQAKAENIGLPVRLYLDAASYATFGGAVDLAEKYWTIFFQNEPNPTQDHFRAASLCAVVIGDYKKALEFLLLSCDKYSADKWRAGDMLLMARYYTYLGNKEQAGRWYASVFASDEQIFDPSSLSLIKGLFEDAQTFYLLNGQPEEAHKVLCRFFGEMVMAAGPCMKTQSKAGGAFTFSNTQQKRVRAPRQKTTKRTPTRQAEKVTLEDLRQKSHDFLAEKHKGLCDRLEKIDLSDSPDLLQEIANLKKLGGDLEVVKESLPALLQGVDQSEDKGLGKKETLIDFQTTLAGIEARLAYLERRYAKIAADKRRARVLAHFKALSHEADDVMPAPESGNLRGGYGHGKAPEPSPGLSNGPDTPKVELAEERPVVSMNMLKTAQKDYLEMKKIPGMLTKYKIFLAEIRANPLATATGSGRPKKLVGDAEMHARRFDKGNRFVYKVQKSGDNTYNVTIFSLLGHYTDLDHQIKTLNIKKHSSQH
ncbi:MAG: hypothetical protein H2057_03300 [Alphaproteobacteria bacterium]|nr:hypothetical protein [Alphaproteobacteria bacterium]